MQELKEAEALLNSWTRERRNTVKLFRDLADEIQEQEEKRRDVAIAGATISVVGGYVAVVAGISAIFTAGATLYPSLSQLARLLQALVGWFNLVMK
jgi:cephalosporin-C deacetylase-like acetyl esterase